MSHTTGRILFAMLFLLLVLPVSIAQAQTPQATLTQYISDLQKSPNDYTLREKIIRHVQTMRQKPAIPEESERYMARGAAAVKGAKTEKDFQDAAAEFEKASLAAPWLPTVYYNLGITQDKAGKYREAIQSLKLYLLAAPDASDAKAVKNLTYEIEYRQEKAAKESSPAAVAAKKQQTYEEWLRHLDGARYVGPSNVQDTYFENELIIRGSTLFWRQRITQYCRDCVQEVPAWEWYDMAQYGGRMQIVARQAKRMLPGFNNAIDVFTISEDGKSITQVNQNVNGGTFTFYRQ